MKKWRLGCRIIVVVMTTVLLAGSVGSYSVLSVQAEDMEAAGNTEENSNTALTVPDDEAAEIQEETVLTADDLPELPDSDELFSGYVDRAFYGDLNDGISTYGNVGADKLTDANEKKMYNELKAGVKNIADGKIISTKITVDNLSLSSSTWGDSASKVISYLMMDCPYDLYWYDKTKTGGVTFQGSSCSNNPDTIVRITFTFRVAKEYQHNDNTTVNSQTADTVKTAAANANAIVSKHSSESDREKLASYCREICNLTDYNHDAAENADTAYGNPWQLIWVFDEKTDTKVVCEGYSKALQYLCDLSNFSDGATACYTVTGGIPGGHMWNIITLGGKNYLADVTNSDSGTIGQDGSLFLTTPIQGTVDTAYTFSNNSGQSINYTYDTKQIELLGKKILSLSAPGEPSYDEPTSGSGTNQGSETKPDTGDEPKPNTNTGTKPDTGTTTGTTAKPQPATTTKKLTAPASKTVTLSLNGQKLKNNTTLKATYNKKYTFKATVTDKSGKTLKGGNAKITWSTSNKKIATVTSGGKVSVKKKAGTVTITAKTADGKTAKVKLKVSKAAVKVTKITITGSKTMSLKKKKTQTLKAAVAPASAANQKVTWKSSNKKIAVVNSKGKVTAKKAGTVTITAAAKDGSKKKAAIKIKVSKK